jgi:hypothetical protein
MVEPRSWSLPTIPEDVKRLSAVSGDLVAERDEDHANIWNCRSAATGRVLVILRTPDLLARYSPLTEVVDGD